MVSPVSPLRLTEKVADAMLAVAEAGAQFQSLPCPMMGTTCPITIAGAVAQQHAEILASFVLVSAARPGLRVLYSSRISAIDLRTAASEWGAPEVAVSAACATQLAHRAGFACDVYGLCTSAPRLDQQTAYERLSNALIPALAGADVLSGVGFTDNGATGSLALAAIDDEIMSHIRHTLTGIAVDADTLALGLAREVIADGGTFLDREATIDQIARGNCWKPGISRPHRAAAGASAGDLLERARQRVDEILRTHQPEALPVPVDRELDVILSEARRELCADAH
jgi:trimethylamine--corrinoid protein Co-methyltransferase